MPELDASKPFRIGTRGSPLAVAQAHETRHLLSHAHGIPLDGFEIVTIKTTADRVQDRLLKEIGGKGLFTKEIEEALLDNRIDIAVHCVKDMAVAEPDGLITECFMKREDPRDAFIGAEVESLDDLPQGAVVGSASLRRRAQMLNLRPDLQMVNFRGSIQTRLQKLEDGVASATLLAMAGLNRLGMQSLSRNPIPLDVMTPAVGQGALAVQRRSNDDYAATLIETLHHPETERQMAAERSFLATLEGSCQTPIAGYAQIRGDRLHLRGEILRPDGTEVLATEGETCLSNAAEMGEDLARQLLGRAPADFFYWRT
ncbi:hydroxymethylbilane synthase [Chachezhania sediminis]|uniref:hydroxymethylbilane synthase n=1 Tax=Chachezhania sediminis TaxID=2599291 RepID=UPI00131D7816|nr:hydroxymethylbilane synthase [Chachezhania sediminis]